MFGFVIGFKWAVRIASIFFCLVAALLHKYNLPILNWLWNFTFFDFVPLLLPIAGFFLLAWVWPGGK